MGAEIFMIAGEPSGDALGAALMKGMRKKAPDSLPLTGIGGPLMKAEGLRSLLPMEELCVMGLFEILGHLPRLMKLVEGLVEEIEKRQPAVLVTIDLPDFNFQIAKRLKKRGIFKGKIVHYVAPSVWAWRPGRAKKVARFLDGLMCLFPFEPPYFEKEQLKTIFVGHPLVENDKSLVDRAQFRQQRHIAEDELCVGVFFGSRESELKKHAAVFIETLAVIREHYPTAHILIPTLPNLEFEMSHIASKMGKRTYVTTSQEKKWDAFAACDVALAVSGTVGLELAFMGVPHIVAYKTNFLTGLLLRLLVRVKYAHLVNILLDRPVVPECLQGKCHVVELSRNLMLLIREADVAQLQKEAFREVESLLRPFDGARPSDRAAEFVLSHIS